MSDEFISFSDKFSAIKSESTALENLISAILNPSNVDIDDSAFKKAFKTITNSPLKASLPMSNYPVTHHSNNVYKAVIQPYISPENTPLDLNLFINHDSSIPGGTFVIDYFNSGELYCNLSLVNLIEATNSLNKLYARHLGKGDFANTELPIGYSHSTLSFATVCKSPTNPNSIAWSFPTITFFNYTTIAQDVPLCEYYSHRSSDNSVPVVISSHYKYANTISDFHSCSHPKLATQSFTSCGSFSSFSSCPLYCPIKTEILSNTIASSHSSSSINFSLTHSLTAAGNHVFIINNDTLNQSINTLNYPSTLSYDECLQEATSIYTQYIDPYLSTSHSISENEKSEISDSNKDVEKESYITSLLAG